MLSEIGSNFWIQPGDIRDCDSAITPDAFGVRGEDFAWVSTGRSAIAMALEAIEERNPEIKRIALIPSFTCHTVIEPFLRAGYRVESLPVGMDLQTSGEQLAQRALETGASVVLFHRYFGFDTVPGCERAIESVHAAGVKVIEDRTQCLYSGFSADGADYTVASIRKWHGVPDGGFIVSHGGKLRQKPAESDLALERAKVEACRMKYAYLFLHEGKKEDFLAKYRDAEDMLSEQDRRYAISGISLQMQQTLDVERLRKRRRENFRYLLNHIRRSERLRPIFSDLPEGVTPLYFPVLTQGRQALQKHLAERSIYAPVVWPRADCLPEVCEAADQLYERALCIPIDQRYEAEDMERIVKCLNEVIA